jgi:hypothetical protein
LSPIPRSDPSFFNRPALPIALADTMVPDFPLRPIGPSRPRLDVMPKPESQRAHQISRRHVSLKVIDLSGSTDAYTQMNGSYAA